MIREFLVGLLFLILVGLLAGAAVLLIPLLLVLSIFFRVVLSFFLLLFAIWLVGKVILMTWKFLSRP